MPKRKLGNPLALAVLSMCAEAPRHPYEMAQVLRQRGKQASIKINFGSLYTVVQNLEKHGFIEAAGTERDGRRPERTVYGITEAGRAELHDWLSELLSVPVKEYPQFEAGLSLAGSLPPDEVEALLRKRLAALDDGVSVAAATLEECRTVLPDIFLVEADYALTMQRAEAGWLRELLRKMETNTLSGMDGWRAYHATGEPPQDWIDLEERVGELPRPD
ncbi:PadR family transcriptional regulator [Streptacidiphilus jiangxiensis]|uniref:DNA-binding transcriptional regulator, PadR family n=1 Tax=Streptacidiphilus jiangxiensis TaxID=235985 RepID=A0A1H7Z9W9_STRJI|nr:PadR family transcriptional regulator [Streptacidiphilus jiangxiensis]SEM54804.1 DNA-binding transcriptional regulator, PadR family [Streptacidiphilus jiangxiensis]